MLSFENDIIIINLTMIMSYWMIVLITNAFFRVEVNPRYVKDMPVCCGLAVMAILWPIFLPAFGLVKFIRSVLS